MLEYYPIIKFISKRVGLGFMICNLCLNAFAQSETNQVVWNKLISIDTDSAPTDAQKLQSLYELKKKTAGIKGIQDSTSAGILLKIGKYEFRENLNYSAAIKYTSAALLTNGLLKKNGSRLIAINSYYNLAFYYQEAFIYQKALSYYDSAIHLCENFPDPNDFVLDSRRNRANVLFLLGDYQKCIDESIIGMDKSIRENKRFHFVFFLNRKAQSLFYENKLDQSLSDADTAILYGKEIKDAFELATAFKTKALVHEKKNEFARADFFYRQTIQTRLGTKEDDQIASDYNDLGNFYLNSIHDYANAEKCYFKTIEYAKKMQDSIRRSIDIAMAYVNLCQNNYLQNNLKRAESFYLKALHELKLKPADDILKNPSARELNLIGLKDLALVLMSGKTQLLLQFFKTTHEKRYLEACIRTAFVTDSVITETRHQQLGEQSKLYWRNKTRMFFNDAMEACYLANDPSHAFYFMEKSRAVLLNDQLNELGAAIHLPPAEAAKQEFYQLNIIERRKKFSSVNKSSPDYSALQLNLVNAIEDLEHYFKSLEQKYPLYYQYKYADNVPSLKTLQQYLALNKQSFVHYFLDDSVAYILAITPVKAKILKLSHTDFNITQLTSFLQICSDRGELNKHYYNFTRLSYSIYKSLFEPLQIPTGRVVICADNFLIPFEALCADAVGKHFLINDFAFSYVYSARYLMNKFNSYPAKGDFLGIAPVSFASYLDVLDLKQSAVAINASSDYYNKVQMLTNSNAARSNFIRQLPAYTVVNIFSHARADTSDNEPLLFMTDSVIHLSELQLLNNPATKLVVLSACQTNVGRNATGEGIYSLARGFAAAGIPAVSATLWKADEETIYNISEIFNKNLSLGMSKDEALQQAKLYFLKTNKSSKNKLLPYYWANMILVGNTDPIKLSANHQYWWWIAAGTLLVVVIFIFMGKRKPSKNSQLL